MMACTGSRGTDYFYPFLNSALDGDEWSTSGPGHFTAKKQHLYLLNREQGGPQSRSERSEKKKNLLLPELELQIVQPVPCSL